MLNQELYKIYIRKSPFRKGIVFVTVIVERDGAAIIGINSFQGNDEAPKIADNIFYYCIRITEIGFGIHLRALVVLKEGPMRDSRRSGRAA